VFLSCAVKAQDNYQHLIMYGQSLSVGAQSYPLLTQGNIPGTYTMGNQIWINYNNASTSTLYPLTGTIVGGTPANTDMTRASGLIVECPLYSVTNHIQQKTGGVNNYLASSCGYHGRTIEQLSKGSSESSLYNVFLTAINSASVYAGSHNIHLSCPAIFWLQGENNYVNTYPGYTAGSTCTTDKDEYISWLVRLKNDMQQDILSKYGQTEKPLFITYQVGAQYIKNKQASISMAQLEASNRYSDIICAGPVYPMTDRGGHLDPNGYRWYGEMMGKVYYKTKVLGEDFKPLQPVELARTTNVNQLKIRFLVPELPLVLDDKLVQKQTDYGFELYANGVKQSLTAVTIDDDCVYLTAIVSLAGKTIDVLYAGQNTAGHGNLRDSDPYQAYDHYTDLDTYPRAAGETTLRPAYEPRDNSGIIYGKPYPLHNFSVTFYYSLAADKAAIIVPSLDTSIKEVTDLAIVHNTENGIADEINALLNEHPATDMRFVAVSGSANLSLSDCQTIVASFPNLIGLDLSGAKFSGNAIPAYAFENLSAAGVKLPTTVASIGNAAFKGAARLKALTLYKASVADHAFENCTNLQAVYFTATTLPSGTVLPNSLKVFVPYDQTSAYSALTAVVQDGTVANPYKIATPDDLDALRLYPSQINANYELENDIDVESWIDNHAAKDIRSNGWLPIGTTAQPMAGSLNGKGYFIRNIWINRPSTNDVGVFGNLKGNSTTAAAVNNLGVQIAEGKSITGSQQVGGIAGSANENVWLGQVSVIGNITGEKSIGGLIGANFAKTTLKQCYTVGTITASGDGAGGLSGLHYTSTMKLSIDMCYTATAVSASTANGSGAGLVGGVSHSASTPPSGALLEIKNSFAINSSVAGKTTGRLVGWERTASASIYTHNFAFAGMTLNGAPASGSDANQKTAKDISNENLKLQNSYETSTWDFSSVWKMKNSEYQLPVLNGLQLSAQPQTALSYLEDSNTPIGNENYLQILLYGQSLGMGWETPRAITTTALEGNYMLGNSPLMKYNNGQAVLTPLTATVWEQGGEQPIVSSVNVFSEAYRAKISPEQKFIAMTGGEGGQTIERLSKECTNSGFYTSTFTKILDNTMAAIGAGSTVVCPAIVYMQGEYNCNNSSWYGGRGLTQGSDGTTDKAEYKRLLLQLKNNMQADIKARYGQTENPLFFIYQTSGNYIKMKEMPVAMAQYEFDQENEDVIMLNPHYALPDYNGGHLSTNGYRWYGEIIGNILSEVLVENKTYEPLHPSTITIAGNTVTIDYFVPSPPLVLDTWTNIKATNFGFAVYKNNAAVSISSVEITRDNQLTLTCNTDLTGTIEVVYAGNTTTGTGNVSDSYAKTSRYTYFDDTADAKKESYTPKDKSGNKIYGQNYPMQNWSVGFYHKAEVTSDWKAPDANDPIVATKYYNVQGQPVGAQNFVPLPTGVYIVKQIHASGKITITKQLAY
jgi:hypothetical protein